MLLQGVLKTMINDAKSKGELWTRDWASAPVPTLTSVASLGSTQIQAPHPMAKAKCAILNVLELSHFGHTLEVAAQL